MAELEILQSIKQASDGLDLLKVLRGYDASRYLVNGTDFNTIIENGKYQVSNPVNHPDTSTESTWLVDVIKMHGATYLKQTASAMYTNTGNAGRTYERFCYNGSWSDWREMQTDMTSTQSIVSVSIPEELLANANYARAYMGTVHNSTSMPNTGQFRVQYIPYFASNEGYAVQVAWGAVNNEGLWYRKSHGTEWQPWIEFATKQALDNKLDKLVWMPENTSIDAVIETGIYKCSSWVSAPIGNSDNQGTIVCINYGGGASQSWTHQTFYSAHYNKVWTRNRNSKTWTDWTLNSTCGSWQIASSSIVNGWSIAYNEPVVVSRSGGVVSINGFLVGGTKTTGTLLFNLPVEFRPSVGRTLSCTHFGTPIDGMRLFVQTDGNVTLHGAESTTGAIWIDTVFHI